MHRPSRRMVIVSSFCFKEGDDWMMGTPGGLTASPGVPPYLHGQSTNLWWTSFQSTRWIHNCTFRFFLTNPRCQTLRAFFSEHNPPPPFKLEMIMFKYNIHTVNIHNVYFNVTWQIGSSRKKLLDRTPGQPGIIPRAAGGEEAQEEQKKGMEENCCNTSNRCFHLRRAENSACMTARDLEGAGLHVDACCSSCMWAVPCQRCVVCVGTDMWKMEEWSKKEWTGLHIFLNH